MPKNIKIALIGCGQVAQSVHLPILHRLPHVEIVALAETDETRRQRAAQQVFGNSQSDHAFSSYEEMLATTQSDAVVICLPSAMHADAAIFALDKTQHVYLEKPLATSLSDGIRVLEAWQTAGTIGVIGFNYRLNRLYQKLRQRLQNDEIGELVALRSTFSTHAREIPTWRKSRASGGGVLFDLASHHIDLLRFLMDDEIAEVSAMLRSQHSENDSALLQLRFESGVVAQTFVSLCAVEEDRVEVFGKRGKLVADRYLALDVERFSPILSHAARLQRMTNRVRDLRHAPYLLQKMRAANHEPSYYLALSNFIKEVRKRQNDVAQNGAATHNSFALPDFGDGFKSLAVIAAAEESAQNGRFVVPQKQY